MSTDDLQTVAHMNPDGRIVPGRTMRDAVRDGGAMLSSLRGYSVPLVRRKDALSRIEALERERDEAWRVAADKAGEQWDYLTERRRARKACEALEAIEHALRMGFAPAEILDENSPIRDGIRAAIAQEQPHG